MYGNYLLSALLLIFQNSPILTQSLALSTSNNNPERESSSILSDTPPQGNDPWVHSVIFEPLPKIKLTQSSYQVTTFLDFQPFLKGFEQVKTYIDQFIKDLNNPDYIYRIPMRIEVVELALKNDTEMSNLLQSSGCWVRPNQCMTTLKILKYHEEVQYLSSIFDKIYHKFLAAIDHLDYHAFTGDNANWTKRSTRYQEEGKYEGYNRTLTPDEIEFAESLLYELKRINPVAHDKLKRFK